MTIFPARPFHRRVSPRSLLRDIERVEKRLAKKAQKLEVRARAATSDHLLATAVVGFGVGAAFGALARRLVMQQACRRPS